MHVPTYYCAVAVLHARSALLCGPDTVGSLRAQGSCRGERSDKAELGCLRWLQAAEDGEGATAHQNVCFGVQNMESMTSSMALVRVLRNRCCRDVQGAEGGPGPAVVHQPPLRDIRSSSCN